MAVWKLDWKKTANGPKWLIIKWSPKSRDLPIWIPDTHTVRYSDESSLQVFSIWMVTVLKSVATWAITKICFYWFKLNLWRDNPATSNQVLLQTSYGICNMDEPNFDLYSMSKWITVGRKNVMNHLLRDWGRSLKSRFQDKRWN